MKKFRLPRKSKKEIRKGFSRVCITAPATTERGVFWWTFQYTTPGRKTKSFFRLVQIAKREEKNTLKQLYRNESIQFNQFKPDGQLS